MILDFQTLPSGYVHEADICIVGSGAAGIILAQELSHSLFRVVLLESGGSVEEPGAQDLLRADVTGAPLKGLEEGRRRVLGGTTTLWPGGCVPFCDVDFEKRDWVPNSGWPIALKHLKPYYDRAQQAFGIESEDYSRQIWDKFGLAPPEFDASRLGTHYVVYMPQPNMAVKYRDRLKTSRNVTVMLHATVANIGVNEAASSVERVTFRSGDGKTGTVKARTVILCSGGIENARLLLMSDDVATPGLGNQHDNVGRYFQDHPGGRTALIKTRHPRGLQDRFNMLYANKRRYWPQILLSKPTQVREQVLSCRASLSYDLPDDSGLRVVKEAAAALKQRKLPALAGGDMKHVLRDFDDIAGSFYRYAVRGLHPAGEPCSIWLEVFAEQAPDPDSRITLSDERDALGIRRARVNWRLTDLDLRTIDVFSRTVAEEFARLDLGHVEVSNWLRDSPEQWRTYLSDSYHHIGTTRLSDNPEDGVVDKNCMVHGVNGLYVAGSSVFPTSACSNPTFTIAAMAIRLADHVKVHAR